MLKEKFIEFIRSAQKLLIVLLLFLVYLIGFGMTKIFMLITGRWFLRKYREGALTWLDAEGYCPDINDCLRGA